MGGLAEDVTDLLDELVLEVAHHALCLESPHELGRRRYAHVAADQSLLEPFPRLVVAGIEGGCRQLGSECAATLREGVAHAAQETRALGLVRRRDLVAEELGPGTAHAARLTLAATLSVCCGRRRDTTCDTPSGPIVTP